MTEFKELAEAAYEERDPQRAIALALLAIAVALDEIRYAACDGLGIGVRVEQE